MLRENHTAILARNETWSGEAASEAYEAGWAREAVIFVRALRDGVGAAGVARVQISPDGMVWLDEGTQFPIPVEADGMACARVTHFGNWLRLSAQFEEGAQAIVLVTLHLK